MHKLACCLLLAVAVATPACAPKKIATKPDVSARDMDPTAAADYYFLLYQELSRQGQARQAVPVLEKLIELAPTPELYRDLANLHWGLGEPDKTREVLEEGLKKFPDEKVLHFYMANSFLLQRRFDEAAQILKDYLAKHPKDQSASQELAAVLIEAGRFQDALGFLAAVPKDKRTPTMAYYEARAYAGLGKQKLATDKLHQALREDPNLMPAWSELAYHYEQNNEYRQAEEAYRHILDLGEEGPEIWLRLIRLALKEKDEQKALEFLDKAPTDRAFLFEVMGMFMDEGFKEAASTVLERLTKEEPGNPDVLFIQAMMAAEKEKNLDKALNLLAQIPKDSKIYDKSLGTRIQLALDSNRFDIALPLIQEGRQTFPDRIEFYFYEAVLHDKQGDLSKAAAVYLDATNKWPGNTEALYRYAVTLERMKQHDQAMDVMERVLTLEPNNPDALNFVGYALAEQGRDLDRALDMINRALMVNPDSPYYIDSLAWVLHARGDNAKAWVEIQKAVTKPLEDATIWEHYGDIAKALNHRKDAENGYRRALEMNPDNASDIKAKLDGLK
jgi:tetratricopeptide (TPR) repeat protein